ncbi:MAG: hypothetical protein IT342_05385, partial [Candidatus Melainabacteria bacterium]|nr:hypothetical protein [Candidatus Melainabacteria bacterium]
MLLSTSRTKELLRRGQRGSTLVLIIAIFLGVVIAIAFFALDFVRFVGGHQEQETAIEAAALAAAREISRIVIEDPNIGFVALSNAPPACRKTAAGDNFYTPVKSINSLLATNRLDLIIADVLKDPILKKCALADYDAVRAAGLRLSKELSECTEAGGQSFDANGDIVNPWQEAVNAYKSNKLRMASQSSALLVGTLKITLGVVSGLSTNCQIPSPSQFAYLDPEDQFDLCYAAYRDITYGGRSFVFAATGSATTLVDGKKFKTGDASLPYAIPCVVKCEASEEFQKRGSNGKEIVHCVAYAEPPCLNDTCPTPGSLVMSFPGNGVPEVNNLLAIFSNAQIKQSPTDLIEIPLQGDFPQTQMTKTTLAILGDKNPPIEELTRVAFYDWLKRGREKINVQSLLDAMKAPVDGVSGGKSFYFNHKQDGSVNISSKPLPPLPELPVSHMQWRAVSGIALHSQNGKFFDVVIKDFVHKPGRMKGGLHAGEPLGNPLPPSEPASKTVEIDENPAVVAEFPIGPPGGAPRPTYSRGGIAVELRFRERIE